LPREGDGGCGQHRSVSGFAENSSLLGIPSLSTADRFAGFAVEGDGGRGQHRSVSLPPDTQWMPLAAVRNHIIQVFLHIRQRAYAGFIAGFI